MTASQIDLPVSSEEDVDQLMKTLDLPAIAFDPFGRPWFCIIYPKAC